MAKKRSALERSQAAGQSTLPDFLRFLYLPGIFLAALGVLFCTYQIAMQMLYQGRLEGLQEGSVVAAQKVKTLLEQDRKRVGEIALRTDVAQAFAANGNAKLNQLENTLKQELNGAVRIDLVKPDIELLL